MTTPYEPPRALLTERLAHGLEWPELWRLRVVAWTQLGGGVTGLLILGAAVPFTRSLHPLEILMSLPFFAGIACGALLFRDPSHAMSYARPLVWAQLPHFQIAGFFYEFYLGALALVEVSGDGRLLVKPGGGAGFRLLWDSSGTWAVGLNLVPFVFIVWLGRIERALLRIAAERHAAQDATADPSPVP